jgi:hypothetical protein
MLGRVRYLATGCMYGLGERARESEVGGKAKARGSLATGHGASASSPLAGLLLTHP